jgi:hypothetical protein
VAVSFDFTALDFETARITTAARRAPRLARVRGNEIVESVSSLMQPPPQYGALPD